MTLDAKLDSNNQQQTNLANNMKEKMSDLEKSFKNIEG